MSAFTKNLLTPFSCIKRSNSGLDQWKRDAQPWPAFLSKETQEAAVCVLNRVEEALSRQRLNYIVSLIDQLTAEEKEKLLKMLR